MGQGPGTTPRRASTGVDTEDLGRNGAGGRRKAGEVTRRCRADGEKEEIGRARPTGADAVEASPSAAEPRAEVGDPGMRQG